MNAAPGKCPARLGLPTPRARAAKDLLQSDPHESQRTMRCPASPVTAGRQEQEGHGADAFRRTEGGACLLLSELEAESRQCVDVVLSALLRGELYCFSFFLSCSHRRANTGLNHIVRVSNHMQHKKFVSAVVVSLE